MIIGHDELDAMNAQIAAIAASIKEWGWTSPALVGEDGGLIAGHASMIGHPELHRGRDPQRFMNPAKIVVRNVQRDSGNVVLQLFRECVCQASEAALLHPQRQILPFNIRGREGKIVIGRRSCAGRRGS